MSLKAHQDFQGHHPTARPYAPHNNKEGLVKLVRLAPLSKLCLGNSDDELLEPIVVQMGCAEPKMWYVDTAGCGRLQANPANPPPRNGFVRKAMRYAAVLILSLMVVAGASSCQKPPEPTPAPGPTPDTISPVVPDDTITPVNPGDTLDPISYDTIPGRKVDLWVGIWMPESGHEGIRYPTKDTIRFYANHPGCDTIFIKWYIPPNLTNSWTPGGFRQPRDTLKTRFAMSPKIYGGEKIYVNKNYGGASIPCEDSLTISKLGMTICDSAIFAGWGYRPMRVTGGKTR